MTQHAHDFRARQAHDAAILAFYAFTYSGEHELRSILARLSEDERATVRHLATTFYNALIDEETAA
jgi:hypothetical protein